MASINILKVLLPSLIGFSVYVIVNKLFLEEVKSFEAEKSLNIF